MIQSIIQSIIQLIINNKIIAIHKQNDRLHNLNGPSIKYANGDCEFHINGKLHRTNGPAIDYSNGCKYCRSLIGDKNYNGELFNFNLGLHNRLFKHGKNFDGKEYWLNGKQCSFEEWDRLRKMLWIL